MQDFSYHILDIVENSVKAEAENIEIRIMEDTKKDVLEITIRDDGRGIDEETLAKVKDPFYTTRTTRSVGLGISLLEQAAQQAEGDLQLSSKPGEGSTLRATFRHSHIDRKPLGSMSSSLITLLSGNPGIHFIYQHSVDGRKFIFDSEEVKKELDRVDINHPQVLKALKEMIEESEVSLSV